MNEVFRRASCRSRMSIESWRAGATGSTPGPGLRVKPADSGEKTVSI